MIRHSSDNVLVILTHFEVVFSHILITDIKFSKISSHFLFLKKSCIQLFLRELAGVCLTAELFCSCAAGQIICCLHTGANNNTHLVK